MSLAKGYKFIPEEHFAKKGSHCYNAHMVKTFYCDASRVLHHPAALGEEKILEIATTVLLILSLV